MAASAGTKRTRVLFVCAGNACRSQVAEAMARHLAGDVIEPSSAGLSPFGRITESTLRALAEKGVAADGQFSKGLSAVASFEPEIVVNLCGLSLAGHFPLARVEKWDIEDPFGGDMATHHRICDDIESRVKELAAELRAKPPESKGEG